MYSDMFVWSPPKNPAPVLRRSYSTGLLRDDDPFDIDEMAALAALRARAASLRRPIPPQQQDAVAGLFRDMGHLQQQAQEKTRRVRKVRAPMHLAPEHSHCDCCCCVHVLQDFRETNFCGDIDGAEPRKMAGRTASGVHITRRDWPYSVAFASDTDIPITGLREAPSVRLGV